jgi:lysophospholipase L1-like esterase
MLGDSLTEFWNWAPLNPKALVLNFGVSGDTTMGAWARLGEVLEVKPDKIFVQIGINDLSQGRSPLEVSLGHARIWGEIRNILGCGSILIVCSLTPLREDKFDWPSPNLNNERVKQTNSLLKKAADLEKRTFVDLFSLISDDTGQLREDMSLDGAHLSAKAYGVWLEALRPYATNNYL